EETWLDDRDHPAAFAIRTADGRRGLLRADAVRAVDPDAQELLVSAGVILRGLQAPRVQRLEDDPIASWQATGTVEQAATAAHARPSAPALAAARMATKRHERPIWQTIAFALACLATLILFEIGLDFGIAYLLTGRIT